MRHWISTPAVVFESFGGTPEVGDGSGGLSSNELLERRYRVLARMSEVSPVEGAPIGGKADEYLPHYEYAYNMLRDARFREVLDLTEEEKIRYRVDKDPGIAKIGNSLLLARNVLAADAGARFLWVANSYNGGNGSFDNHDQLYGRGVNAPRGAQLSIYESGPRFDSALGSFVEDLMKMPGKEPGKTLWDETMIVIAHEFGRNPEMNSNAGRDHWGFCFTNLFMGGGVKPGRIIGKTDGYRVTDVGWKIQATTHDGSRCVDDLFGFWHRLLQEN